MKRLATIIASLLPLVIIGGLLYASFFLKMTATGVAITPGAVSPGDRFYGLTAPTDKRVWAVGNDGKIVVSDDGGRTWRLQSNQMRVSLQAVVAWNDKQAATVGGHETIMFTENGGETWVQAKFERSDPSIKLMRMTRGAEGQAWAVGEMGSILRTFDFGKSWRQVSARQDVAWNDVCRNDTDVLIVVGEFGRIMRTRISNDNSRWESVAGPVKASLTACTFKDSETAVAVGLDGQILVTRNAGTNWERINPVNREHLFSVIWDSRRWLAVGSKGLMLQADQEAKVWAVKELSIPKTSWFTDIKKVGDRYLLAGDGLGVLEDDKFAVVSSKGTRVAAVSPFIAPTLFSNKAASSNESASTEHTQ